VLQDSSNDNAPRAFLCQTDSDEALIVHIQELDASGHALHGSAAAAVNVTGLDWLNETPLLGVEFDDSGVETVVQYSKRSATGFNMQFRGATARVSVFTPLEHSLSKHMLPEEKVDVSKYLLCPMPGKIVSCDVTAGQRVEAGQELAVVEAMKMQNVLRAEKAGVIKTVSVQAGDTLKVDAVILEFEE
jgi:propionyl-CoA carboxylase alpha chain